MLSGQHSLNHQKVNIYQYLEDDIEVQEYKAICRARLDSCVASKDPSLLREAPHMNY